MNNSGFQNMPLRLIFIATVTLILQAGCLPDPSAPKKLANGDFDLRPSLDLSSPQASFATMVEALKSNDDAVRLACMTDRAKQREAGAIALRLMDMAIQAPVGGDKYLKFLEDHGLSQVGVNRAMATSGIGADGNPLFTERLGMKIKSFPKFHQGLAKLIPRPVVPSIELISTKEENDQAIGQIKIDDKEALMVFRKVDGYWLIDSESN